MIVFMTTTQTTDAIPAIDKTGEWQDDVEIVLLHDHYREDHLAAVVSEMQTLGAPVLRAAWSGGHGCWYALEGCHRLRAAHKLGLMPLIVEVDEDDEISEDTGYDLQDPMTAGEIIDANISNKCLSFARGEAK
jgi:hypothetical protein